MAVEEAPPFWWTRKSPLPWLLAPVSFVWGRGSAFRMRARPSASVPVPVLCIGNFIAGGAGKTPTAIEMARAAKARGLNPGFLSRGHGGKIAGPAVVDLSKHHSHDVGDEPLLLAEEAVTVVCADRPKGARLLVEQGCDFVIMDDGFQNPSLAKDFSLLVVDAKRGLGNGFVMPSGPMRAPLGAQLALAHAVLVIGDAPGGDRLIRQTARRGKPVHIARVAPVEPDKWKGRWFLAFAGIADPTKFFDSLRLAGAEIFDPRGFGDHHHYTEEEAREILDKARLNKVAIVTTTKDMARLHGEKGDLAELAHTAEVFEIGLAFDDPRSPALVIDAAIRNAKARMLREKRG